MLEFKHDNQKPGKWKYFNVFLVELNSGRLSMSTTILRGHQHKHSTTTTFYCEAKVVLCGLPEGEIAQKGGRYIDWMRERERESEWGSMGYSISIDL